MLNVVGMKKLADREEVSLEYSARREMAAADRQLRELDEEEDGEEEVSRRRKARKLDDVVLDESFAVLMDLIRLTKGEEIPRPRGGWLW
jgi:hypothetical protein